MFRKAFHELMCRIAPKKINVPFILFFSKIKCFKLVEPYVNWYIMGSKYDREYESNLNNHSRVYIAYDGCFDMGNNFQHTIERGWLFTILHCHGVVHPYIKNQIVVDHKEQFPLDYYLLKLQAMWSGFANYVKQHWQMYIIYAQLLVISNMI